MGRGRSTEALGPWSVEEEELAPDWLEAESHAGQPLSEDYRIAAEELPLRRDLVALLAYLREHRVTGTQSRGNLPLKAVREICARFVQPPELETRIGRYTHVVRSEDEVGPLLFRHLLLYVGGLVSGGRGRRWRLTGRGVRFLSEPAPLQVVSVLEAWWARANWAVLSPFAFEGGSVPARFPELALAHLLDLRVGEEVPFELFADRLIEGSRMAWPIQNQESARRILGTIVPPDRADG